MALDGVSDKLFSRRAMKAELLDAETELQLAYAWRDHRLYAACDFNGIKVQTVRRADE